MPGALLKLLVKDKLSYSREVPEPEVLQRQRNKGAKDGGRGIVPGALLKLLVKDKLSHSREVPELDVLQRQRNKGAKDGESGGRGIVPGVLLKLLVKDKLPHSREVRVNVKEWQLKLLRRKKITAQKYL